MAPNQSAEGDQGKEWIVISIELLILHVLSLEIILHSTLRNYSLWKMNMWVTRMYESVLHKTKYTKIIKIAEVKSAICSVFREIHAINTR